MAEFFLHEEERELLEHRALNSAVAEARRDGYVRLYNKNDFTTLHVEIVGRDPNRFGWIIRVEKVPPYFRHVLIPHDLVRRREGKTTRKRKTQGKTRRWKKKK